MRKRILIVAGSLAMFIVAAGVVLMTLALYRYGNIEGIADRVRIRFAVEQPHEDFVPTPETAAGAPDPADLAAAAALLPPPASATAAPILPPAMTPTAIATTAPSVMTPGANLTVEDGLGQLASLTHPSDPPARQNTQAPTATPTPGRPRSTATKAPTATATPAGSAAPKVGAAEHVAGASGFLPAMRLEGLAHYWQTWNNCGPATLSMNLSYFGITIGQDKLGEALKPEKDDKNVGPEQLAEFARSQGLRALVRVNGDSARLKALLQAGIPVLVETWYEPKPNDGMGHYRLIVGYDDAGSGTDGGHWIAYDSYDSHGLVKGEPYRGVFFPYSSFDALWKVFGRTYVPIYDSARAPAVEAVVGADMDDAQMWQRALAEDLTDVKANSKDAFAWFNVGTDYVRRGDYESAAKAYDAARQLKLPWRMLWYQFGPFEAYYGVGRHQEVINLADATLKTAINDEELYYWKGLAQQALGDPTSAKASFQEALRQRPTYQAAIDALGKLE